MLARYVRDGELFLDNAILMVHAPTVPATFLRLMRSLVYQALI